ncbi:hypothetical protein J3U42_09740 [Gilliamella sp. B2923]|uniref:DUF6156 family protein n=2 Tax=Gilliamella TaxID=1193503 RepID=UPI00226AF9AD|nr:DUF6156 family protein [Gilliamella sp. B2923]MCX8618676.1 hypothetical protein [Gilliamella sp. B2923]
MKKIFLLIPVLFFSFYTQNGLGMEEVKYYESFSGYDHPIKLNNEIDLNSLKDKNNYLKAIYINNKLKVVEKYINNNLFFSYVYVYEKNKLIKIETTNINGEKKTILND